MSKMLIAVSVIIAVFLQAGCKTASKQVTTEPAVELEEPGVVEPAEEDPVPEEEPDYSADEEYSQPDYVTNEEDSQSEDDVQETETDESLPTFDNEDYTQEEDSEEITTDETIEENIEETEEETDFTVEEEESQPDDEPDESNRQEF